MKKNTKILSLMLSALLLLGFLPMYADASDTVIGEQTQEESIETVEISSSSSTHEEPLTQSNSSGEKASVAIPANGVYQILAFRAFNRWISVENSSPWAGNNLQQIYSETAPIESFDRASLFKISQVGTTGRYIIRSMLNNNLSFGISGTEIITKTIPSNDTAVSASDTFYIEASGSGYHIRPYGSSYVINMASTSTANLNAVLKTSATNTALWTFSRYTGETRHGVSAYWPASWSSIGNIVGSTGEATLLCWSTYINVNTPSMSVDPDYSALGYSSWNASTSVMRFTSQNIGNIYFTAKILDASGTVKYSALYSVRIVPRADTYYICNAESPRFVNLNTSSITSDTTITQRPLSGDATQKWIVEHVSGSGGYIRFKSAHSGRYMAVNANSTSFIIESTVQNDYTLWKLDRTGFGHLRFTCKATESTNLTLWLPVASGNVVLDTRVEHKAYVPCAPCYDEWDLFDATGSDVYFLGITGDNHDHVSAFGSIMYTLDLFDYSSFNCVVTSGISKSTVLSNMEDCRIYVSRSHGDVDSNGCFMRTESGDAGKLYATDIYNFSAQTALVDLSNCDLMLFVACKAGAHETQSLPHAAVAAGAEVAIGFKEEIACGRENSPANEWTKAFIEYYFAGYSLDEAARYAAQDYDESTGLHSYRIVEQ